MKTASETLLNDLEARTRDILAEAKEWQHAEAKVLNHKPAPEAWSALECLEHLNKYGRFYHPEMAQRMEPARPAKAIFRSGWLGNYFAKSMLPKENLNTMKTFASMDPANSQLQAEAVLSEFVAQQERMLELLEKAHHVNLSRTRSAISISKWITLRLGDAFRVVIYHNQRHIVQARRAMAQISRPQAAALST